MVKNDFLLRVLLLFGFFWFFKLIFEFISMIYGWFRWETNWFAIIAATVLALIFHARAFVAISKSIAERGKLSTTVRWFMYVLVGYGFYISIIKGVEIALYDQWGFWHSFNNPDFLSRPKGFAIMIGALIGSVIITKSLVPSVGYLELSNAGLGNMPQPIIPSKKESDSSARQHNDKSTIHGSSKFSDFSTFNEKYNSMSNDEMYKQYDDQGGYVISPNVAKYINHSHAVTIAGAGQGKGTTAIIPNLLSRPKDNWIILDVKGENAAVTARFQKEAGQDVYIIDPFNVQKSINAAHDIPVSGFNPLIVAKYLPSDEITDFAAMIAEMLVPEAESKGSTDNFWVDSARNTIKTYILHLITEASIAEEDRHLGKIYEWLRLTQEDEVKLWVDMAHNPITKFGGNEIQSLALTADKTWGGIQANARKSTAFLDSPLIQKSLGLPSADSNKIQREFDPMLLQNANTTVYVILPERNLNTHKAWLRIIFGTMLKLCNFVAKRRVNFLMDEFPILGRMDDFLRAFAFGRGQKISCWVFAQSLSQLKEIYGEDGLNTILSNARIRQFFGMNDLYTQTYVSDLLGYTTEITTTGNQSNNSGSSNNVSSDGFKLSSSSGSGVNIGTSSGQSEQIIQRKLMLPDEVGNLKNDFILLIDGEKYIVRKWPYYTPNLYSGRFDPNPYVHL